MTIGDQGSGGNVNARRRPGVGGFGQGDGGEGPKILIEAAICHEERGIARNIGEGNQGEPVYEIRIVSHDSQVARGEPRGPPGRTEPDGQHDESPEGDWGLHAIVSHSQGFIRIRHE